MDERVRLLEDLANPVRYGVLIRVSDRPRTASELAAALAVSPTQLANHLRRLRERGLVRVQRSGRHTAYELAEPGLRDLFSVLNELRDVRGEPPPRLPSREAGTCYDHLSGRLGVALLDALLADGALVRDADGLHLAEGAEAALARFGATVPERRRRLMAYGCLDASEGRPHLGGALGAELARSLEARGWIETAPGERRATVTDRGRRELGALLGPDALG